MTVIQAIILGIIQGLTEFLPISSSAHLVMIPKIFGFNELSHQMEQTFDVALHAGTLVGAVIYLRKDLKDIFRGIIKWSRTKESNPHARLGLLLFISTIPGALIGAIFSDFISETLTGPALIATMLIIFGVVLFLCDKYGPVIYEKVFSTKDSVYAGCAQAIALQPGVSRSGITISALRLRGYTRETSARLSFLMLVPIVAGATLYSFTKTILGEGIESSMYMPMLAGFLASAITGFIAVFFLIKYVQKHSYQVFMYYRIAFGLIIFAWIALN